jgi:predicted nucleic acid-binding protein
MNQIIIADTSCLIVLSQTGYLYLLKDIFGTIIVTETVAQEFKDVLPEWVLVYNDLNNSMQKLLDSQLDPGESSAIAFAYDQKDSILLIDEKKGRKIALDLGISIIGTIKILIIAKRRGKIASLKNALNDLLNVGFWVSEKLIAQILAENPE